MTQITGQSDAILLIDRAAAPSRGVALVRDLATLTKPRIASMVGLTTWLGYLMADAAAHWLTPVAAIIGATVAAMGAAVLNQVVERDTDALMRRTQDRPTATGRVSPALGGAFGLALCAIGVLLLALLTTPLAAALTLATIVSYVLLYTPV